ncbi:MAG TPA: hypothetical protein VF533_20345 [Solirubrobacteraceae bacterium]|jgi:hypothetical protein
MSPIFKLGARNAPSCPACARPVYAAAAVVRVHGDRYHAECVLYQPRRTRPAPQQRARRTAVRA